MDPGLGVWLEIAIFGGLLYIFMYFTVVKGPTAGKIKGWLVRAREARKRGRNE